MVFVRDAEELEGKVDGVTKYHDKGAGEDKYGLNLVLILCERYPIESFYCCVVA